MMKKLLFVSMAVATVSGCSVVGESADTCPGSVGGLGCASVKEVYELTNIYNNAEDYGKATGDPRVIVLDEDGKKMNAEEYKKHQEKIAKANNNVVSSANTVQSTGFQSELNNADAAYQHLLLPAPEPIAMRKPADVVRVLARPYVDENDTLQVPGYGYIEATERTWLVDRKVESHSEQYINYYVRKVSQSQDNSVSDDGQIGVTSRSGKAAESTSNSSLKDTAKKNAASLISEFGM